MTPEAFTGPVEDLSTDQGFQFGFACARCGAAWRTDFRAHGARTLEGVLERADDVLNGLFAAARAAIEEARGPAWLKARAKALADALLEARSHFGCCARCAREVCGQCWDPNSNLCADCLLRPEPDAADPPAAQVPAANGGEAIRCAACGTPVSGGRFCPVCSHPL